MLGSAFSPVVDAEDAAKRMRDAGVATFVLAGMEAFGGLIIYYVSPQTSDDFIAAVSNVVLSLALVVAGLAMRRARGGVTLIALVMALFIFEIGFKITTAWHPSLAGWMFFYAILLGTFWSGLRGARYLRTQKRHMTLST